MLYVTSNYFLDSTTTRIFPGPLFGRAGTITSFSTIYEPTFIIPKISSPHLIYIHTSKLVLFLVLPRPFPDVLCIQKCTALTLAFSYSARVQ